MRQNMRPTQTRSIILLIVLSILLCAPSLAAQEGGPSFAVSALPFNTSDGPWIAAWTALDEGWVGEVVISAAEQELFREKIDAASPSEHGLRVYAPFASSTGEHALRFELFDDQGQSRGSRTLDVVVPNFETEDPILLPLVFLEDPERTPTLIQREEDARIRYPFSTGRGSFLPKIVPVLPAGTKNQSALMGYRLDGRPMGLDTELIDAQGKIVDPGAVRMTAKTMSGGFEEMVVLLFELSESLSPGAYTLRVMVDDLADMRRFETKTTFEIAADAP